jgi:HK97 family phage portal protein
MNIFQRAISYLQRKASQSYSLSDKALIDWFGGTTYAGKSVDEKTAMQISTVFSCVRVISETIGFLPWSVYEKDSKGNSQKIDSHHLSQILVSPNADMTDVEYKETIGVGLGLSGNSYSFNDRNAVGDVVSLYPIESCNVKPKKRNDGTVYYSINDRGRWEDYPQEKIWHVKGFSSNGLVGYSPIGVQRQGLGIALATEEFQARFFASGASPSMIVSIPEWLDPDQRKIARENLEKLWGGVDNAHKVRLLEGGMTASPWTMALEDAQFLQLRELTARQICGIYRVPPHLTGDLTESTNNNIEQQSLEFVMYTIMPYLRRIETGISKWLLKPTERGRFSVKFNVDALLRADAAARGELYSKMLTNGAITRNEVRALENLNRSEIVGMDDFTVQAQLVSIKALPQSPDQVAKPAQSQPSLPADPGRPEKILIYNAPPAIHFPEFPKVLKIEGDLVKAKQLEPLMWAVEAFASSNTKNFEKQVETVKLMLGELASSGERERNDMLSKMLTMVATLVETGEQSRNDQVEKFGTIVSQPIKEFGSLLERAMVSSEERSAKSLDGFNAMLESLTEFNEKARLEQIEKFGEMLTRIADLGEKKTGDQLEMFLKVFGQVLSSGKRASKEQFEQLKILISSLGKARMVVFNKEGQPIGTVPADFEEQR